MNIHLNFSQQWLDKVLISWCHIKFPPWLRTWGRIGWAMVGMQCCSLCVELQQSCIYPATPSWSHGYIDNSCKRAPESRTCWV